MSGFSADWLALREPADASARSHAATTLLANVVRHHAPVRFIDLGTGTASNVRFLAPRLGGCQEWLLTDRDLVLLEQVPTRMRAWCGENDFRIVADETATRVVGSHFEMRLTTRRVDLASGLRTLQFGDSQLSDRPFANCHVVTASALLDLVSDDWLQALAEQCHLAGAAVLLALNYDGRMQLTPTDPDDEWIRQLINLHQRGDKGFGPALGPDAATRASRLFAERGYEVRSEPSDWRLGPADALLQRQLIDGWAGAAAEIAASDASRIEAWRQRRVVHVDNARSHAIVGHQDLVAWRD